MIIPCPARVRCQGYSTQPFDELPPFEPVADSDSVPAIERHASADPQAEPAETPANPRTESSTGMPGKPSADAATDDACEGDPTGDRQTSERDQAAGKSRGRTRLWTSIATMAALGLVIYTLRDKLPSMHDVGSALTSAQPRWVAVATALELVSLTMFARQQRALLASMAVRMSMARALAVTYARSAIAISMPAGTAVSAAFAYQQYRRSGASRDHAGAVMVLSGLISFVGLGILYLLGVAGVMMVSPAQAWRAHSTLIIAVAVVAAMALAVWPIARRWPARPRHATHAEIVPTAKPSLVRRWSATAITTVRHNVTNWRGVRPRHWAVALTYAVLNWLLDLLCLVAATVAFNLHIGIMTMASMYLGVQLVRQVPITPGGIGLIETGLMTGFAALGAPAGAAAAVVLTYRVLSCWLLIPVGGLAWLGLRASAPAPHADQDLIEKHTMAVYGP